MAAPITEKSTKNDILAAYNEALAKIKELKTQDRKVEKKKEEETKLVESSSDQSVDKIINGISSVKLEVLNALDDLGEKLVSEFRKFTDIRKAIEIERTNLEELYEIKSNADSLSALLYAQKEKKDNFDKEISDKREAFETEMNIKRQQWKLEQENHEAQKNERDILLKKERKREEEEYNYNLQLTRKKEMDSYLEEKERLEKELLDKKTNFEKELAEREAATAMKEKEFSELQAKAAKFPQDLEKAIADTERMVTERLEFKYTHQIELTQKEIEGERNLNKQTIASLEKKIKEQEEQIKQLSAKSNEASLQVQTIAIKAIEGASTARIYNPPYEKNQEGKN